VIRECRAFGAFAEHFPEQAASVLSSFDRTRQRQLLAETSAATASVLEGIVARGNVRQGSSRSSSAQRRPSLDEAGIDGVGCCYSSILQKDLSRIVQVIELRNNSEFIHSRTNFINQSKCDC